MSKTVLQAVMPADIRPPSTKLMAVVLAWHYNDEKRCAWPSVATLAARCCVSERQAQRMLSDLVDMGVLHIVQKGGGRWATRYGFDLQRLEALCPPPSATGDAGVTGDTGDTGDAGVGGGATADGGHHGQATTPVSPDPRHGRREPVTPVSPERKEMKKKDKAPDRPSADAGAARARVRAMLEGIGRGSSLKTQQPPGGKKPATDARWEPSAETRAKYEPLAIRMGMGTFEQARERGVAWPDFVRQVVLMAPGKYFPRGEAT